MKTIRTLDKPINLEKNTAIALGTFDGVHIAHQAVIEKMVEVARAKDLLSVVYTFSNHPRELNHLAESPKKLITPSQKIDIMSSLGVDILVIIPFDEKQLNMPAEQFIEETLISTLKASHLTVGYDFRFGKNARGCTQMLKDMSERYHYTLDVIEPIRYQGMTVSSTMIRNFLLEGDVKCANTLLGREYAVEGHVVKGKQVGRTLGFPTINLKTEFEMSVLRPGVYVTQTEIDGELYYSATNVGFNPTFDQEHFTIETFILDYERELYGHEVRIIFKSYIRPEKRFENLDELIDQIDDDVKLVRSYFNL